MKVLVIGQPRSRSNFITAALSNFYNVPNFVEPYRTVDTDNKNYAVNIQKITDNLLKYQDFVCKLQTSQIKIARLLNFFNHFQFNMYDQVFITERKNIVEQIASLLIAQYTNKWSTYYTNPPIITFDPRRDRHVIKEIALEIRKVKILKDFLDKDGILYQLLNYEDIDEWVKNNLANPETIFEKSNYDYKKLISNYSQLEHSVLEYFNKL
jgi:LPS sulfotransferase NodH